MLHCKFHYYFKLLSCTLPTIMKQIGCLRRSCIKLCSLYSQTSFMTDWILQHSAPILSAYEIMYWINVKPCHFENWCKYILQIIMYHTRWCILLCTEASNVVVSQVHKVKEAVWLCGHEVTTQTHEQFIKTKVLTQSQIWLIFFLCLSVFSMYAALFCCLLKLFESQ